MAFTEHSFVWHKSMSVDHTMMIKLTHYILHYPSIYLSIVDFVVPSDYGGKIKEGENIDNYLDFARGLNMLWNMLVTVILIGVGALGKAWKGGVEMMQTTALLKLAAIHRKILEIWGH